MNKTGLTGSAMLYKKNYLLAAFLLIYSVAFANVINKSGNISSDEIWAYDTVKITGDITVDNAVTLTINAGCVISFQGHYSFNVQGRVVAKGESNNRITFRAVDTILTTSSGGWQGVRFDNTNAANDTSIFTYCDFYHGNAFGPDWFDKQGAVFAFRDFGKTIIMNNKVMHSQSVGANGILYVRNASPLILGNLIANNAGTGIELSNNADPSIINNTIVNNKGYGINRNSYTPVIKNCIISGNNLGSIKEISNQGNYISYSNLLGAGFSANSNIDIDPKFADEGSFDYHLTNMSPCVDAGSMTEQNYDLDFDIDGNARIYKGLKDTLVDMGAYELNEEPIRLFTVNPDTLEFNNLLVGESQTLSITIENNEAYPITLSSIYNSHKDFTILGFTGKTLNTREQVSYDVKFDPKWVKQYNEYLIVEHNYKKQSKDTVWLTGQGLPSPKMVLSELAIEETLNCTTSVTSVLTIENTGSGILNYSIPYEFTDNFESGLDNWNISGSWGMETNSYGSFALTENPNSNYQKNVNDTLTMKKSFNVFDAEHCVLEYMLKTDMENCCDSFNTEIKVNNLEWQLLDHRNGIHDWTLKSFNLSSLVSSGDSIKIRFRFNSDNTNSFGGIWLDDLQLTGAGTEDLSFSSTSGSINPGESEGIDITFDANGKAGDDYKTNFRVLCNDPTNYEDTIGMVYNLNRFSTFELITNTLQFDTVQVRTKDTLYCQISNYGCDTLKISKVFTNNFVFWVDTLSYITVVENDTVQVPVVFNAVDSLQYEGKVYFVNNSSTNDTITANLLGKGSTYPILSLSSNLIDTSLMCDETVLSQITISNLGSDTLNYSIPTDLFYEFSDTIVHWTFNGSWGLETDSITNSEVLSDSPLGNYKPSTNSIIELKNKFYVFDASNCNLSFDLSYDIEACCDSFIVAIQTNGADWVAIDALSGTRGWDRKSYNLSNYLNYGDSLNIRFRLVSDGAVHKKGVSIDNVKITGSGNGILNLNRYQGELLPTESHNLQIDFTPTDAFNSQVKTDFRIVSNSPFKLADTVHCNYFVKPYSTLTLLKTNMQFNNTKVFNTDTVICQYVNLGCDTLKISSVFTSSSIFTIVGDTEQQIIPADTGSFKLVFNPIDSLDYNAVVSIVNSGLHTDTTLVNLHGKGLPYPVLSLDTNKFDTTLYCHEQISVELVLTNTGNDTLQYNLPQDFSDRFSQGNINWALNNGWAVVYDSLTQKYCITESISGNYLPNTNASATLLQPLRIIDAELASLSYYIQHDIEACCDNLYTEISVNNASWQTINVHNGTLDWNRVHFDLSPYLNNGDSLLVRFRMVSDFTNAFDGALISDVSITGIGSGELELSKMNGAILPHKTDTINVTFNAAYQSRDKYQKHLQIVTNNPYKAIDSVLFSYNVIDMSSLNLVAEILDFSNIDVLAMDSLLCKFYNIGCDTLEIKEVFVNNNVFAIDTTYSRWVLPNDTGMVKIIFTPVDSVIYNGQLSIVHTGLFADTSKVSLIGKGNAYPVLELIQSSIDTTQVCGTQASFQYSIRNMGTANMEYYIPVDFVEDFENGLENWEIAGNWGLVEHPSGDGKVLTESPNGNYENDEQASITLINNIMVLEPELCTLSFDLYHYIENCCDFLFTEIQINNGDWLQLDKVNNLVDWSFREFDLSSYVTKNDELRVRFRFTSDIANNYDGALIDNVKITGGSFHEVQLVENRGELAPGERKQINVTSRIPIGSLQSVKGNFFITSNDPYNPVDTLSYSIRNNFTGIETFHGGGRSGAVSFVLDSSVYIALGSNKMHELDDVWRFDIQQDLWVPMNDFPGGARTNATAFVLNDTAYVGLGFNQTSRTNFNDLYKYDARKDRWTRVADYIGKARSEAVVFTQKGKAYVGSGINIQEFDDETKQFSDFWAYNPKTNRWDTVAKPNCKERSGAIGFSVYNKGYLAGGFNKESGLLNDIWEYYPDSNLWVNKKVNDSLGYVLNNSTCQAFGNRVYITYGNTNQVFEYHPQSNKIHNLGDTLQLISERQKPVSFLFNKQVHFGLGNNHKKVEGNEESHPHVIQKLVLDYKHSPTDILLSNALVKENGDGSNWVGNLSTSDLTANDEFTYMVIDNTKQFFIDGNRLMSDSIDYEQTKKVEVTLRTIDNEQNYFDKKFMVTVEDIVEAPFNLQLSNDTVSTNNKVGDLIAVISVQDQDTLSSHEFKFNFDLGLGDTRYYAIEGNKLLLKKPVSVLDTEHRFHIEAVDNTGLRTVAEARIAVKSDHVILVQQELSKGLKIYPNPAANKVHIVNNNSQVKLNNIYLHSLNGELVIHKQVFETSAISLDIDHLKSGVYILTVTDTNNRSQYSKLVVE